MALRLKRSSAPRSGTFSALRLNALRRASSFCVLEDVLTPDEVGYYAALYDADRRDNGHMWSPWPQGKHSQHRNCEPLVSSPAFASLIRHPRILGALEAVFGAGEKACLGEACLRWMPAVQEDFYSGWHRDGGVGAHALRRPLHVGFLQLIVYFDDVDEDSCCFSLSPEPVGEPHLWDPKEQLAARGEFHLEGPAGTCAIFNPKMLHAATFRKSTRARKTLQVYYGHQRLQPGDYGDTEYMLSVPEINRQPQLLRSWR